jgi:mRNA interferase MazF
MTKDFESWHLQKSALQDSLNRVYFYEREIWWTAIGHNIGDEEDGKGRNFARPVVIIKKFNRNLFYGLPLSTAAKQGKYYHSVTVEDRKRLVLLSHMRDYDAKRLLNRLDVLSEVEYFQLILALVMLLRPE